MTQTGPRSVEAKRRVSVNAVRHGLRSTRIVIPGLEVQADWEQFFKDAVAALTPAGAIEYALAERIATLLWRLRRAARAERDAAIVAGKLIAGESDPLIAAFDRVVYGVGQELGLSLDSEQPPPSPDLQSPRAPAVLPVPLVLQNLSRYEYRLSRQLLHAMHELQALQDRRQGNAAPLARIDVHGLPCDE